MLEEIKEKPNYYAILPSEVRYDLKLRDKAKLLYGEITALSNDTGCCWAQNEYFANLYNVSKTTISLLIKNLVDRGYIRSIIIYKKGTKEILKRCLSIVKYPIEEKLKDNNTSINKKKDIYKYISKEEKNTSQSLGEKIIDIINYFNTCALINKQYFKKEKIFKLTIKNKEAVKLIKARLNDEYTVDDFKDVIFIKYMDFVENEYFIDGKSSMRFYCPETLFASKHFGKYKADYNLWSESC